MGGTQAPRGESAAAILRTSPDAILLVDADGVITYASDRVNDLFGYEPEELRGRVVERLLPEDDREAHVAHRESYTADPETRPMGAGLDLYARRKDGTTVPVDVSLSPIEMDGELRVITVVRDVTEREALRTKYRTILEAVPDPVVVAETSTRRIVEVNELAGDLLGYEPGTLVGEEQTALHPDGEEDRYRGLFDRHVAEGRTIFTRMPDGRDIYVETSDGERIPVEINAHVFELGERKMIAGVFRDVTARKEHERRLEALHEVNRRLIAADDREEIARLVARASHTMLGYTSTVVRLASDETRLRPVAITDEARTDFGQRPEYSIDGDSPAARAYRRGEPLRYDDVGELEDGHDRAGIRSAMYVPMGEHGVISVVDREAAAFDRSDVELASILAANAETALTRLAYERKLTRQNDRLEEFAGVVSHDLRNPLNVAQGWLSIVREECESERLARIADPLDRMEAIIEDTLTLARQGRTVTAQESIGIGDLTTESWEMVETGDARLEVDGEFRVMGDRERLRHVFENLFRNAVEHGGEAVTVRVGPIDGRGFYVEDDGPGIPEDDREPVFDPGRTSVEGGTGFGLAIVRRIAEAHGWHVRVTAGTAGGARFEFTGVEVG
ncbi:MAG: PAS domain-containing sensor histidine kinase [Salinigranum sp.]